ncbi:RNA polymerase II C-terminal domain kinase beta subunit [Elasticomyces elasticus]|nr:RNA polymerase II C-terminal domain kinase beta subunit [Elasticomyces elasticus]
MDVDNVDSAGSPSSKLEDADADPDHLPNPRNRAVDKPCEPVPTPSPDSTPEDHSLANHSVNMAPATPSDRPASTENNGVGPHPSYIQVSRQYIFEHKLQRCLATIGNSEAKEDTNRLQGVAWIDNVRRALQLPVRTYNAAVVLYHKFRLVHSENEYNYTDAAAAALLGACKMEDTQKKSREILCAAFNLKALPAEQLSPDDPLFEVPSKTIVGLERLMLEAIAFDFRTRHPQELLVKIAKQCRVDRDTVGKTAYNICLDLYRTFAPLKQTRSTMAISCVELAARLCQADLSLIVGDKGIDYDMFATSRAQIMGTFSAFILYLWVSGDIAQYKIANVGSETLLDLLDLYTHHRTATIVGPNYSIESIIALRLTLNKEATASNLPRFTCQPASKSANGTSNGVSKPSPLSPFTDRKSSAFASPQSPGMGPTSATGTKVRVGERGRDGTVRFMLDPGRAHDEKEVVKEYFKEEYEEYEELVEKPPSDNSRR